MKKFEGIGRKLSKNEQKKITGGDPPVCTNTCWFQSQGGEECGHTDVENCQGENLNACKSLPGCSSVPKTTCSCG